MAATLQAIETKVRRLTRSPSVNQLSQADLDNYINTFILYDFPEHLRTFNLRETFTFYANTGQDRYFTNIVGNGSIDANPLFDFQNRYYTVHPPAYVSGFQAFYTQSREEFFNIYPNVNSIQQINTQAPDGVQVNFTGNILNANGFANAPGNAIQFTAGLIQGSVFFSANNDDGLGLSLVDVPLSDPATGQLTAHGNLYDTQAGPLPEIGTLFYPADLLANNNVNYQTGNFNITFPEAPGAGTIINSQTIPTVLSRPQAVCFYQNVFYLRPVPDQPYKINFEVYKQPTALMHANDTPDLDEYWQYIAYGAAKKIFEDRMDMDSVALIMPEFQKQQALVLRRSIVQYTNERVATIYTEQTSSWGQGQGFGGFGSGLT